MNEPLMPNQRDSGMMIYKPAYHLYHSYGLWNFSQCVNGKYKIISPPYYNQFIPESVNRFSGMSVMSLRKLYVSDIYCNAVYNTYFEPDLLVDQATYIGVDGDSNMCFDINYNQVFSPWSNPGIIVNSTSDSLTIELTGRNSEGSLNVNVYFTNLTQASPSKPQFIKTYREVFSSPPDAFKTKLTWLKNKEPDMKEYKLYKGQVTGSDVDASSYYYIGTTLDTFFVDNSILYMHGGGSGPCERYFVKYVYRVSAVDSTDKESVKSDRDSISGYTDPCGANEESLSNGSQIPEDENLTNSLSQNVPNPFNPLTRINYSIKDESFVSISIYDMTGRLIMLLVNQNKPPGNYFVELNSGDAELSSGIYFYRMHAKTSAGEFIETRKLVILK